VLPIFTEPDEQKIGVAVEGKIAFVVVACSIQLK
jgi:hypothetical protein